MSNISISLILFETSFLPPKINIKFLLNKNERVSCLLCDKCSFILMQSLLIILLPFTSIIQYSIVLFEFTLEPVLPPNK